MYASPETITNYISTIPQFKKILLKKCWQATAFFFFFLTKQLKGWILGPDCLELHVSCANIWDTLLNLNVTSPHM